MAAFNTPEELPINFDPSRQRSRMTSAANHADKLNDFTALELAELKARLGMTSSEREQSIRHTRRESINSHRFSTFLSSNQHLESESHRLLRDVSSVILLSFILSGSFYALYIFAQLLLGVDYRSIPNLTSMMASREEISSLKESYGSRCRVIENQGEFRYIITITPEEEFPFKIQYFLKETYPEEAPGIYLKDNFGHSYGHTWFTRERIEDLRVKLEKEAKSRSGRLMLKYLTDTMVNIVLLNRKDHLNQLAAEEEKAAVKEAVVEPVPNSKAISKTLENQTLPDKFVEKAAEWNNVCPNEKRKLRIAQDVINRILWDERLDRNKFTVGYLDRFTGLVEEKFNAFCWDEPISAVDDDTLAIPRHRIQFFKYGDIKVWDRSERLDLFFSSDKNSDGIYQFLENPDVFTNELADSESDGNISPPNEEDFDYLVSNSTSFKPKIYNNPDRPNFFVAIRVTNHEVLNKIQQVQDHMQSEDPSLADCFIGTDASHITIAMLWLDNMEEIERAKDVIWEMRSALDQELLEPITVEFDKMDDFYRNVVYVKVRENFRLIRFVEAVREQLMKGKVRLMENHCYVPHVTVAKITRPVQRERSRRRTIDSVLYQKFANDYFGKDSVRHIALCPIGMDRRSDGFYKTVIEVDLQEQL